MKRQIKETFGRKFGFLPVLAVIVLLAAVVVTLRLGRPDGDGKSSERELSVPAGNDLVIQTEKIGTEASYFDYDANGTTVQVLAVRAADGTVRLAMNTCQVCNGSPYAYFE